MSRPDNILVIRLSSLGDVLMSLPAVKALSQARPEASLTWLVEGPVAELLASQDFVDRVIPFPRSRLTADLKSGNLFGLLAHLRTFTALLRDRNYDTIVDFHGIAKSALLSRLASGSKRIGFDRNFAKEGSWLTYQERIGHPDRRIHKVERNMLLARRLGANGTIPRVQLAVPPEARRYADEFFAASGISSPVYAVNPFCSSGSAYKRWPLERYGALVRKLREDLHATALILWGPGEEQEAKELESMTRGASLLAPPTTVAQLLALLARAHLYVGGDTGVAHLAAFAGIPVLAIFGPSDDRVNRPYGEGHRIVRRQLDCSPCKDRDCRERACLASITVEEVFAETVLLAQAWGRA